VTTPVDVIDSFQGDYRFLSNFWRARVLFHGTYWATAEHAYQAAKTFDLGWKLEVQQMSTPGLAKKRGRIVELRPCWETIKVLIMKQIVEAKFSQDHFCMQSLLATGQAQLVEGNTWGDVFWGVCKGVGHNHLGRILMEVRTSLTTEIE